MHAGAGVSAFVSVVTAIIGIMSLAGHPVFGMDGWVLIDAALFGAIAWRIFRLSLPWSIVGLLLFLGEKVYMFMGHPVAHGNIIVAFFFFLAYVNAVRGGLYLQGNPVVPEQAAPEQALMPSN